MYNQTQTEKTQEKYQGLTPTKYNGETNHQAKQKKNRDVFYLYLKGELAARRGDVLSAIEMYQRAINEYHASQEGPLSFDSSYTLWATERREGLLLKIEEWLSQEYEIIAASSSNLNRRGELANKLLVMGLYDEAIIQYKILIAKGPEIWQVYYNLGIAYEKIGKIRVATKSYLEGLRLAPNSPKLLLNYGMILKKKGGLKVENKISILHCLLLIPGRYF